MISLSELACLRTPLLALWLAASVFGVKMQGVSLLLKKGRIYNMQPSILAPRLAKG
jgi:hypothetical protein